MKTKLIFIVDYGSLFQNLLKFALEVRGFSLLISDSSRTAEQILDSLEYRVDAMLIDASLAKAHKFSLYKKICLLKEECDIPIYILLDSIEDEYLFKEMDLEITAYLFKSQSNISNIILLLCNRLHGA